jgi:hypothetical protein
VISVQRLSSPYNTDSGRTAKSEDAIFDQNNWYSDRDKFWSVRTRVYHTNLAQNFTIFCAQNSRQTIQNSCDHTAKNWEHFQWQFHTTETLKVEHDFQSSLYNCGTQKSRKFTIEISSI